MENNANTVTRLKRRNDFTKVYKRGKSYTSSCVVLCCKRNGASDRKVGFTVSKKIGNAVVRNKVRRRMKEITRLNPDCFPKGYDYVFVARKGIHQKPYEVLQDNMLSLLKKVPK